MVGREENHSKSKCWEYKEKGYNISLGGDGGEPGSRNSQAKFTEEQIQILYKELKENLNETLEQIAKKYNIHLSTLSNINNGHTYYHSTIEYPIRKSPSRSYIDESKINIILDMLLNTNMTQDEIGLATDVHTYTVGENKWRIK